jgi:general secretion pathway protein E
MPAVLDLSDLDPKRDDFASRAVDRLFKAAVVAGASDIHIDATPGGVQLKWRVDGSLVDIGWVPNGASTTMLGRIKALARLITYRHDIPQEGRLAISDERLEGHGRSVSPGGLEARVGTLPTLHGERAVIRIAAKRTRDWLPTQLGLPTEVAEKLNHALQSHSGVILLTGTAGAGKTTTAYACLREILSQPTFLRSVVTLEDPIESELDGAAQSQVNPSVGYDWSSGLKALLRQDPEVMMVSEIRDAETAEVVFQAAMTGQLVITTMHARSAADALRRLLDMQLSPHHLRSALNLLLCQRLLRRLCSQCDGSLASAPASDLTSDLPQRCPSCLGTGFQGRLLLAEWLPELSGELAKIVMQDADCGTINRAAQSQGMETLAKLASTAVAAGQIPASELRRHFIE